jgi:Tfp pilus assembly protein PilF
VRTALALLLHQAGQRQAAAAAYEQVIARGPENPLLLNNLAVLYQELGDRRAADTARRAYELAPQRPEIVDTYGWILVQGGRVQEGLVMLQQAYVTAPHHPEIAYHVGAALVKAGRKAEARPILERVVREHPGTTAATDAQALLTSAP